MPATPPPRTMTFIATASHRRPGGSIARDRLRPTRVAASDQLAAGLSPQAARARAVRGAAARATTRWARRSASARTRAGGGRWSRGQAAATGRARARRRHRDRPGRRGAGRRCGCRVVGLDQSAAMLGAARGERLAADPALGERVELVEGEAEALPFADGEFDHLTFTYLLRYVDDPAATLRELARVVRPGGRDRLRSSSASRAGCWLWAVAALHARRPAGARPAGGREAVVRGRPLPRPEHRGLLRAATRSSASSSSGARPGSSGVDGAAHEPRRRAW